MYTPKITVGISFKNPGDHFEITLQSIFAQTFTDWELILIDDGSTDKSLELANQINDKRVRVYSDGESQGLNLRLNQMIKLAETPYFFRMDADDIMHPQRLEKQYQLLLNCDEDTVIGSSAYSIDENSQVIGLKKSQQKQKKGFAAKYSFYHPTVAASTKWFRKNNYSNNFVYQRCEDAELWCRISERTRFINLPEPLLYYRETNFFSLDKYLLTNFGALYLINEKYKKPFYKSVYLFSIQIIKIWLFFVLDTLNFGSLIVSRRYKHLNLKELKVASEILESIQKLELPLSEK
jgi:glycosyltransferase involved in cell wall biosynthesis